MAREKSRTILEEPVAAGQAPFADPEPPLTETRASRISYPPYLDGEARSGRASRTEGDVRYEQSNRKRVTWGAALIVVGLYLLGAQMGWLDWISWRPLWPAVFIIIGMIWMVAGENPRQIGSGFFFIVLGLWFYACTQHWYGLTYRTGWPLLLVASGLDTVLVAVLDRSRPAPEEEERHA
jgi:hypothetical protein